MTATKMVWSTATTTSSDLLERLLASGLGVTFRVKRRFLFLLTHHHPLQGLDIRELSSCMRRNHIGWIFEA
jgi:hypothetical protein